jgi:hypothetical protein
MSFRMKMLNLGHFAWRFFVSVAVVALFGVHFVLAQSWSVQDGNGDPVQVDHNSDGSWTVTPQGGTSTTYGAASAANMVNDYGISSGDF